MSFIKETTLLFFSLIIIALFFSIDFYRDWFDLKILGAVKSIPEQLVYMDPSERYGIKLGDSYSISVNIAEYLKKNFQTNKAVVLLPPRDYVKEKGVNYPVPEPIVFYYYTGIKSVWANSKNAATANYAITINNNKGMFLVPVTPQGLDTLLNLYRKYNLSL